MPCEIDGAGKSRSNPASDNKKKKQTKAILQMRLCEVINRQHQHLHNCTVGRPWLVSPATLKSSQSSLASDKWDMQPADADLNAVPDGFSPSKITFKLSWAHIESTAGRKENPELRGSQFLYPFIKMNICSISYRHIWKIYFQTWVAYSRHVPRFCLDHGDAIIVFFAWLCMSWTRNVPRVKLVVHCSPSVKPFHFLFSSSSPLTALWLAAVAVPPICSSTYLLLFLGLMTVWYLSRVPSVPWYALLCHCCCLVSLSLFLLLLLHHGSQPTLTYVFASYVLISNLTMLLTLITSSPDFFVTLLDTPKHPLPLPQTFVSLHPTTCYHPPTPTPHDRTSWDRSTVHLERSWAHLPAAWRNL